MYLFSGFLPDVDAAELGDKETSCKGELSSVSADSRDDAITGKCYTWGNLSRVVCENYLHSFHQFYSKYWTSWDCPLFSSCFYKIQVLLMRVTLSHNHYFSHLWNSKYAKGREWVGLEKENILYACENDHENRWDPCTSCKAHRID